MFERAVIRGIGGYPGVDLGLVAETLLFYKEVHLALDRTSLTELIKSAGILSVIDLLNREGVTATFTPQNVVVYSSSANGLRSHRFTQVSLAREADGRPVTSKDELVGSIVRGSGLASDARRVDQVRRKIKILDLPSGDLSIPVAAHSLLADRNLVREIPRAVLREICPDYELSPDYTFEVVRSASDFFVESDIPFSQVNEVYHRTVPSSHSSISAEYILAHVVSARCDAYFAASRLAELVTTPAHASLIRRQIQGLMQRRDQSVEQYDLFEDVALPEGRSIRQVINSKERGFSEFLALLDKSQKFRDWLHGENSDMKIVREYLRECTSGTWIESLPAKVFRFGLVSSLGALVNPAVGLGIGAFDAFVVSAVGKGWKPNQFIEGPLLRFVDT